MLANIQIWRDAINHEEAGFRKRVEVIEIVELKQPGRISHIDGQAWSAHITQGNRHPEGAVVELVSCHGRPHHGSTTRQIRPRSKLSLPVVRLSRVWNRNWHQPTQRRFCD